MKIRSSHEAGFTLVEIMIVVALIGLLAAIAVPNFVKVRATAQAKTCVNNLRQIDYAKQQWALETHQNGAAMPAASDIDPYLGRQQSTAGIICPAGGLTATFASSYTINAVTNPPQCKIDPGNHLLDN
jgi:prepilin-type N-terminal cleavage/methylation domain-containing protein